MAALSVNGLTVSFIIICMGVCDELTKLFHIYWGIVAIFNKSAPNNTWIVSFDMICIRVYATYLEYIVVVNPGNI